MQIRQKTPRIQFRVQLVDSKARFCLFTARTFPKYAFGLTIRKKSTPLLSINMRYPDALSIRGYFPFEIAEVSRSRRGSTCDLYLAVTYLNLSILSVDPILLILHFEKNSDSFENASTEKIPVVTHTIVRQRIR